MYNKDKEVLRLMLYAALMVILEPALGYICGWLSGKVMQFVMGETIINGLNYLFNTERFTEDMLPTIFGTISVIGMSFRSYHVNTK